MNDFYVEYRLTVEFELSSSARLLRGSMSVTPESFALIAHAQETNALGEMRFRPYSGGLVKQLVLTWLALALSRTIPVSARDLDWRTDMEYMCHLIIRPSWPADFEITVRFGNTEMAGTARTRIGEIFHDLNALDSQQRRRHARLPIAGIVGALTGCIIGALVGFILGAINEARLADPAESDLFLGFAEYSAHGLAFFGGVGCSIIGAIAGSVMEFVSRKTKSAIFPIMAGAGSVAAVVAAAASVTEFSRNQFHQEFAVWGIGGIISLLIVKKYRCRP